MDFHNKRFPRFRVCFAFIFCFFLQRFSVEYSINKMIDQVSSLADSFLKFSIPDKLRQKLSQRPAFADAASELRNLSRQLENQNLRPFAAACSEGVAVCEGTSENSVSEAEARLRAARLYIDEEIETYKLGLPTTWNNLYCAVDGISRAAENLEQLGASHLAVTHLLELASAMLKSCRPHDAVQVYQKALELNKQQNGSRERLVILRELASAQIRAGLLVDALNTYEEILVVSGALKTSPLKVMGWYRVLARLCEYRQMLILLIVEPSTRAKLSSYHNMLLDFYTNPAFDEKSKFVSFLEPVELMALKDFTLACSRKDFEHALEAADKLYAHLDGDIELAFVDYLMDQVPFGKMDIDRLQLT